MRIQLYFFTLIIILIVPFIEADKRAPNDECYIVMGYVDNAKQVSSFARSLNIEYEDFELMERRDNKVYLTLGKIKKKLFEKLQKENKTYNFSCSRGTGYEERFGLNSDFNIVGGNKKYLATEAQYLSVVSSIEEEKKRIADLEIKKQVAAQLETLRLAEIEKQKEIAAERERLRLLEEAARKEKEEEDRLAETLRLAEIEKQKEIAAERERLRLLEEAARKEKEEEDRLANEFATNQMKEIQKEQTSKEKDVLNGKEKALLGWRCLYISHVQLKTMQSNGFITGYEPSNWQTEPKTNYKNPRAKEMFADMIRHQAWRTKAYGRDLLKNDPNFDDQGVEYLEQINSVNENSIGDQKWFNDEFFKCVDMWIERELG